MTTNKPEVVAIIQSKHGDPEAFGERELVTRVDIQALAYGADLIRLSDYEDLQADRDQQYDMKVKTREQRDAVTAKLNALQAECEKLLRDADRYRWLRESASGPSPTKAYVGLWSEETSRYLDTFKKQADVDVAFDAAMKGDKP